ncbi:MAG: hypothetical protein RIC29_08425 [Rhodospirillaceae bacterium]
MTNLGATQKSYASEKKSDELDTSTESTDGQAIAQRSKYEAQKVFLEDQLSKTELILALSKQLDNEFLTEGVRAFIDAVFDPLPHALASDTWITAAEQILEILAEVQNYAQIWWSGYDRSAQSKHSQLSLAFIAAIILLAVLCRRWIRDKYPRPRTSHPESQTDLVYAS